MTQQLPNGVRVTGRSLGAELETKMTLNLELCGREKAEKTGPLSASQSPSLFPIDTTTLVCFHYSYFMWYHGIKDSFFP